MARGRIRPEESQSLASERRMQILDAAKRCFRNRGFHQTTLRDIAHEFGMSVGHIYNYFESKEAIIEALVEMQTARLIEMISEGGCSTPTSDQTDARRRLEQFVDIFMDPDSAHLAVAIMDEALINPRVYELTVDATSRVRDFIIKTHYEFGDEDYRRKIPASLFEARVVSFRSMLEGLRFTLLFNPTIDRELLKKVTVDRLMLILQADCEEDGRLTDSMPA